jgi:hypothetical protein
MSWLLFALSAPVLAIAAPACGPRQKGPAGPTQSATVATATATPPPTTATATNSAPPAWTIPGLQIPGLPTSPRQALVGRWKVAGVDGKPVATAPGMATDPMDPASYVAGTEVTFTADQVTMSRGGVSFLQRPYKVVQEFPPIRVTIDAGYGASNVDFALDGSAIWSLPSTPPHALSLQRAQ